MGWTTSSALEMTSAEAKMRLAAFGFKCERPLLADCVEKLENHGPPKISQM